MVMIIAIVFALGAIICYSCCVAGARADKYGINYIQNEDEEEYHGKHFRKE